MFPFCRAGCQAALREEGVHLDQRPGQAGPEDEAQPLLPRAGAGSLPSPGPRFWVWVLAAAISQIVATSLQIYVMATRNFATAVAYTKTEVMQAALFEIIFLGALVTWLGGLGIALGTVKASRPTVKRKYATIVFLPLLK